MKTTHTPGPWEADIELNPPMRLFKVKSGIRVVATYLSFEGHQFEYETARPEEVEANASLIAAAPELLEALKNLLNALDDGMKDDCELPYVMGKDSYEAILSLMEESRTVIAKARSE